MQQGAASIIEVARPKGSPATSFEVARSEGSAASTFEARSGGSVAPILEMARSKVRSIVDERQDKRR